MNDHLNFQKIAKHLRLAADSYPPARAQKHSMPAIPQAEFNIDGHTVRCRATREAILAVAGKYARGEQKLHHIKGKKSDLRRFS